MIQILIKDTIILYELIGIGSIKPSIDAKLLIFNTNQEAQEYIDTHKIKFKNGECPLFYDETINESSDM